MTQHAIAYRIAAAAAALVLLAACGDDTTASSSSGDKPLSTPAASPTPEASGAPSQGKKAAIEVDESEFMIKMEKTFTAGTYTFTVMNSGTLPHALEIDGPGVQDKTTGTLQPGAEGSVTVTLQKGTYNFYCPVGDHESKGMKLEVTVT
jgi:uncharacterized cupredoxin-like copper-binding protein